MVRIILLSLLLAGCCETQYITRPLPLPERPILPVVEASELSCVSDDAYYRLVQRERLRREYAETCEAIVKSTH